MDNVANVGAYKSERNQDLDIVKKTWMDMSRQHCAMFRYIKGRIFRL